MDWHLPLNERHTKDEKSKLDWGPKESAIGSWSLWNPSELASAPAQIADKA